MHQFTVEPIAKLFAAGGNEVWLTTSAVWMGAAAIILWLFILGGMRRQLVPGRWQMAVEGFTGLVSSMMAADRNGLVSGKRFYVRVTPGGRRKITKTHGK